MLVAVSLLLAALVGFAAHRASLCTVRAVAEVLTTRRAYILASFLKTSIWAIAVSLPLFWLLPENTVEVAGYRLGVAPLAGGFLFGVGAALNGACSFSTLSHLAEGDVSYSMTLAGFVAGVTSAGTLPEPFELTAVRPEGAAVAVLAVALVWTVYEIVRLWRSRARDRELVALLGSHRYRLSSAALLLGVSGGALTTLQGGWTHTSALRSLEATSIHVALIVAVVVGMTLSARQRRAFRVEVRPVSQWLWHLGGGLLMGAGAARIPGGNSWLLLRGIPSLSPHALPAYGAILVGIAAALLATGRRVRVECTDDVCR